MTQNFCCLVILNYNGREHLKESVPSALKAIEISGLPCRLVVVDNQSTQDDAGYMRSNFSQVELIVAKKNDYLFSLNSILRGLSEEIIILLNNDMRFDRNFIAPILRHFSDSSVFAVTAKTMDWEGLRSITARRIAYFKNFWFYKKWDYEPSDNSYSLEVCGGAAAIRRSMFLDLGGFDRLYFPGYCEDTDISYRAWKKGWKVIYEPQSVIYHKISATFNKMHGNDYIRRLMGRNEVLFSLKNCGNIFFVLIYLILLPWRVVRNFINGNRSLALGILWALPLIPLALLRRIAVRRDQLVPEKFFLEIINTSR